MKGQTKFATLKCIQKQTSEKFLDRLPDNLWPEILKPVFDTVWGEVLSLCLYVEAERLSNKYDYIKDFTLLYSKITGVEFFINC